MRKALFGYSIIFFILLFGLSCQRDSIDQVQITMLCEADLVHQVVKHGINKLDQELSSRNISLNRATGQSGENPDYYILAGLSSETNELTKLIGELGLSLPEGEESLLIKKTKYRGKPALLLCGSDQVGLMYAALDVAKRISWKENNKDLFEYVLDASESPDVKERTVSSGTFNRRYFEEKLHDKHYWETYFDMMAENRLNQFLLIFGYKNNQYREPNFTAPVYPNFFNLEEYPYVKLSGITAEQQQKNTEALKEIIGLAHGRGIEFGVGLWDQIERDGRFNRLVRDDIPAPDDLRSNIIWGLTQENLIPYTKTAMRKFFQTFPEIDLVQFRMHWEAGITGEVALKFWDEIFILLKEECPDIKIEARAKDVPDETLYAGVRSGADFRVATKHWMEQMGMPFHPTHINRDNQFDRRHGYADLLRHPKKYGFKWRVWSGGTTRAFLWGDPHWVKLFAEGSHLYDAIGFEFNEPLYFKMNGSLHDTEVSDLLNPDYRYYEFEFERYWHYYQVFGRVSYFPSTPTDIWEMEFKQRFGEDAGPAIMDGLHKASKVLPRIVAASYLYPRFASPQGWPELQRMEDLRHFANKSKPSDIQLFASPLEEAELIINGGFTPRQLPSQISAWFMNISNGILSDLEKAEKAIGAHGSNEYVSSTTDLKMLAYLARYHSQRLLAAVSYKLYEMTGDLVSFDQALEYESQAVSAYGNMVEAAGNIYNMQLDFGSNPALFPGHWKNEHQRLEEELEELKGIRSQLLNSKEITPLFAHIPVRTSLLKEDISIEATARITSGIEEASILYSVDEDPFRSVSMEISEEGVCSGLIPGGKREGSLKYYLEIRDKGGKKVYFPENAAASPIEVIFSNDREPPVAELEKIKSAPLNKALKISTTSDDPSGVQTVMLRYRRVSQFEDYQAEHMILNSESDRYEASIPAEFFDGKYDVMYFIEVTDTKGNGRIFPDMEKEAPYVIVHLEREEK